MKSKLRILLVEDDAADAELIERQLKDSGFSFSLVRVQNENDFRHHLKEAPDVILSDHGLPSFSGFKALEITRMDFPKKPFIFVSGSNDQGMVADMYEQGATDYVFKRDLGDLKAAVLRALDEVIEKQPTHPADPPHPEKSPAPPPVSTAGARGKLRFCPRCWQATDEFGQAVLMESYCTSRPEVVVERQICAQCA
ncbi:MAG TPA: response regulator [Verrucomicrobiae bacterium]|nr:response regulator [Verrucomicrobiae bacterium]